MRRKIIYGYRMVNGIIEKHEPEARVICEILSLYIKGMSQRYLKVYLKKNKIQAPNDQDEWSIYAIRSVLTNENYVGNEVYPSIISQENFDIAQKTRIANCAHIDTSERKIISDTLRNFIFDSTHQYSFKHKTIKHMKRTYVTTQHVWCCKTGDAKMIVEEEILLEEMRFMFLTLKMNPSMLEVDEYVPEKKETLLSKVIRKHRKDCDLEVDKYIELLNQRVVEQMKNAECCSRSYYTKHIEKFLHNYDFQGNSFVKELPTVINTIEISNVGELQLNFKNTYRMKGKVNILCKHEHQQI